ncbi:DUF742 domain-containing protein [Streptomyces sp. NPDC056160]|uniref:DUF742 domain-containing protein n=1 Tax=Streptomyces sp. NPDC056160 TaxID=3345731 RepID=UPI0035DA3134
MFVRLYTLTGGRTRPHHLLALDTVVVAGAGRLAPAHAEEHRRIMALCRERPCSVAELAGRMARPVPVVKVLISDLLDARLLDLLVTASHDTDTTGAPRPSLQLLAAVSTALRRKWPDARSHLEAG